MRHRVFPVFLYIFTFALFFTGCTEPVKIPDIAFVTDSYDFGIIDEGHSLDYVFEFTNTGTGTLVLENVRPTCGCTVADNYDKEVEPGKSGKIFINFDSSNFDGPVAKPIVVKTNVPEKSEIILSISGSVKVSVSVTPKSLFMGNIHRDQTEPLYGAMTISNRSATPLKILDVIKISDSAKRPNIIFSSENVETSLKTINDGFEYYLLVTVNPPFKSGQVMGSILIKTDNPATPEIMTEFSYHTEPLVRVFPNPLFINKDQMAKGSDQLINIQCETGYDMEIVDFSVNNPDVTLSLEEVEKGLRYRLRLKFPSDFAFDPKNTINVEFKTRNIPDEPMFRIPVLEI